MNFCRNKILKVFLVVLFIVFYSNITFFTHTHIINGIKVTHSHFYKPFNDDKTQEHQHSKNELLLIYYLSQLLITASVVFFTIKALNLVRIKAVKLIENHKLPQKHNIRIYGLRAPPISILYYYR